MVLADVALRLGNRAVAAQSLAEWLVLHFLDFESQRQFLLAATLGAQPIRLRCFAPLGARANGVARLEQQVQMVEVVLVLEPQPHHAVTPALDAHARYVRTVMSKFSASSL